jgi:uncharacterized protein (DUF427 family)
MKLKMEFAGHTIVSSSRARRVEGIWFVPPEDILSGILVPNDHHTFDEKNGYATWFDIDLNNRRAPNAAYTFPHPNIHLIDVPGYIAIDPHRVDAFEVTS